MTVLWSKVPTNQRRLNSLEDAYTSEHLRTNSSFILPATAKYARPHSPRVQVLGKTQTSPIAERQHRLTPRYGHVLQRKSSFVLLVADITHRR
jgi:hypothetical protein